MNVAWIGMGRIGKPMALRVLAAGHHLTGHARTPSKAKEIADAGGDLRTSLADAVAEAELICVNVYSEIQLREALFDGGALVAMPSRSVLVIHSTVGPTVISEIARARPDIEVLDAAFSGTDKNAEAGTIVLMVGGDATALERATPVLSTYANYVSHIGPLGTGITVKLLNNVLFGANMLLANEALRILIAQGVDRKVAVATLSRSSGSSFALDRFSGAAAPDQLMAGVRPYMVKDVAAARTAAEELGIDLGILATTTLPYVSETPAG